MTVADLIKEKEEKKVNLSQSIMAMRQQAIDIEVAIRRAEGRYQGIEEDLAMMQGSEFKE